MWCGGASSKRAPSSIPVGYASHTGYQYDSISRVAGQREPAPPSKFSKEGGFRNSVFKGILGKALFYHLALSNVIENQCLRRFVLASPGCTVNLSLLIGACKSNWYRSN